MLPVGFEKLIPSPIASAVQYARRTRIDTAMGAPVGLIPVSGKVLTEVDAVGMVSGAEAVVVAAGGLGGASADDVQVQIFVLIGIKK